jgi:hypothetical protein
LPTRRGASTLTRLLGGLPQAGELDAGVLTRMALFALLAVVTVWMAERVRRAGARWARWSRSYASSSWTRATS